MKIVGYLEGYKGKLKESTSIGSDSADESGSSLEVDAIATPSVSASGECQSPQHACGWWEIKLAP